MKPVVTIVVPAYNVSSWLDRCVLSLVQQTLSSIEVLIVDDGSTDATATLAGQLALMHARVRVITQVNGGLSAARNAGLSQAAGEWVCFIDADDWVEPEMLEYLVQAGVDAGADAVIAGAIVDTVDHHDDLLHSRRIVPAASSILSSGLSGKVSVEEDSVNLLGYAWNKLYRTAFLHGHGFTFEPGLALVEDVVFNSSALGRANVVIWVPEAFVHYVQRPRISLGTAWGRDVLELKEKGFRALDSLLTAWQVSVEARDRLGAHLRSMFLWALLRSAAETRPAMHLDELAAMLSSAAGKEFVEVAWRRFWSLEGRGRWAVLLVRMNWLTPGVLLLKLLRPTPRYPACLKCGRASESIKN